MGEGVVTAREATGFVTVFFREHGERRVPLATLGAAASWVVQVLQGMRPATSEHLERLWLAIEAEQIPLMESSATLTSAKVDLLPHQVVLVHRIANARPKRFLIADEVGLGKTIETALILRELASRGELHRAMMVVPAGLVENWRRELNEVFKLDFEVFGYEGDVTDRRSNTFANHHRLIVSVDTLKQRPRVKRLLEAPQWDLVVFDEAHHLSVYKTGSKVKKTENFKLAEAIRDHCRDLLLLSATPHQGDHFRFMMLTRLLDPTLFEDERDMLENRHRLNAVVIRRTKADACAADGSPLFARRMVSTEGFTLATEEKTFYQALLKYLTDGYDLAAQQGNKGRALGFVMTIFQKIAASSFAAIRSTLQRRLLMLTIQESIERDEALDVDGRNRVLEEARKLIHNLNALPDNPVGWAETERILADAKVQLLKKRKETLEFIQAAESYSDTELAAATGEEAAAALVIVSLPEERRRIKELLASYPTGTGTKTFTLLKALGQLWKISPAEKVVIFATYLGTVQTVREEIERAFPDKGVEVLKGGDHGAKTAAQRRFKRADGPKVLVCTAAGREGINLQFARVLFNYDLPWNPMDLEQRIGRIHRYGQEYTAQVYNLVAIDTIEGQIYLLLEEKLKGIAETLGKIDEQGQVAEDLRTQVLGQLGSCLSYDKLYQDAIHDPSLKRTRQELEVAMTNANLARQIVFELFQDLDSFNLNEYQQFQDDGKGMERLVAFVSRAARLDGAEFRKEGDSLYTLLGVEGSPLHFTTDRDRALEDDNLELLGLEHPVVRKWLAEYSGLSANTRAVCGSLAGAEAEGFLTAWHVSAQDGDGRVAQKVIWLGMTANGERSSWLEKLREQVLRMNGAEASLTLDNVNMAALEKEGLALLHRELEYAGAIGEEGSYSSRLLACFRLWQ